MSAQINNKLLIKVTYSLYRIPVLCADYELQCRDLLILPALWFCLYMGL